MAFDDKKKKRIVAITRQLKEKKGVTIKQSELLQDLKGIKQKQQKALELKEQFKDVPMVVEEADKTYNQLNKIAMDLNEYMKVLHPEGLLDFGSGTTGQQIVGQG